MRRPPVSPIGRSGPLGPVLLIALLAALGLACGPVGTAAPRAETASPATLARPAPVPAGPAPAGGSGQPLRGEVVVFAASSLADAFREIGDRFRAANPNVRVTFNFGASSQLRTQLDQGAPADLFASANQQEMDRAKSAGAIAGAERIFARNRLAVIFPVSNPGAIGSLGDLAKPGLKVVTAGPEVPIGAYTRDMLDRLAADPAYGPEFGERVNANVVSREPNVRQVVARISLGEADAAVVYSSDVTPDVADRIGRLDVPDRFNTLATYPIAVVRHAPNATAAEAFMSYVLGPDGQAVLRTWGFIGAS